jgi:hypothetical protein
MPAKLTGRNETEQVKHDHVHIEVDAGLIEQLRSAKRAQREILLALGTSGRLRLTRGIFAMMSNGFNSNCLPRVDYLKAPPRQIACFRIPIRVLDGWRVLISGNCASIQKRA